MASFLRHYLRLTTTAMRSAACCQANCHSVAPVVLPTAGKPLNDAHVLDVEALAWTCVFRGHSDLVLPTGAVASLIGGRLMVLNAAAGSPKLDIAESLDFVEVRCCTPVLLPELEC
jgi:hypothetical protein